MFVMLWLACQASEVPPTSTSGATDEVVHQWLRGTSQGQVPDGGYVGPEEEVLLHRVLDPEASTITETVLTASADGVETYEVVQLVDGGAFSADFLTAEGTLAVEGVFDEGEAWAWTAWHSTSTYVDGDYVGTSVTSEDTFVDGHGTADKVVLDGGEAVWVIAEVLDDGDQAAFEARWAELTAE